MTVPSPAWSARYRPGVAYAFLSDEWVQAARAIRDEYQGRVDALPLSVRMNQIITDVPFGTGVVHAHLDTSGGFLELELGHLESPDLTLTLEYVTAKAIFADGDMQAAMAAFLSGRIMVDGDVTKLLELQSAGPPRPPAAGVTGEIYQRLKEITAD